MMISIFIVSMLLDRHVIDLNNDCDTESKLSKTIKVNHSVASKDQVYLQHSRTYQSTTKWWESNHDISNTAHHMWILDTVWMNDTAQF